ncbi:sensor histidine kinase, partial [Falsiroseomonas oryzae]|uniref:sensor histidine kinase n=1 Tax=Falsiroseomonas oryzae TaxID=2766473 RepID=UPI0022EA6E64
AGSSALLLLLALAVARRQRALARANADLERRVAERTRDLHGRERLLRLAQQAAGAASWSWEPSSGALRWSDEMFALLGLDARDPAVQPSFDGFMAMVHQADRPALHAALQAALREGVMSVEFRVLRHGPHGVAETVWLLCRARLFAAGPGEPAVLVGIDIDITERRRAEERFEVATAAMSGFVYEWDVRSGRIERTAGAAPLLGGELCMSAEAWMERIHPDDRARARADREAVARDPARDSYAMEYRVRGAGGDWVWLWDRGRITRDPASGAPLRMVGGAVDITARRLAEERQGLLLREVDHRAKNALAVVKAALRLTPRDDPGAFAAAIEGRIDALAKAQALLSGTSWSGAGLRDVLAGALEAFVGTAGSPRLVLDGPPVLLAAVAVQPLSMALHELATNATKYGALSAPDGSVHVRWRVRGDVLELSWSEHGGPSAQEPPDRRGFGSRVVETTVRSQLGGSISWLWLEDGLRIEISFPAARVLARRAA